MTRLLLPPFSRRRLLGTAGAASLLAPAAFAQTAPGGTANNGPAINVSGAQNAPIPIAVSPFGASGVAAQITQVISDDLAHSGLFRAIDPSSFVPNSVNLSLIHISEPTRPY